MFKTVFLFLILAFVVSCATVGEQTRAVLRAPPNIPAHVLINGVPFVKQTKGHCGPSTLTMVMDWAGQPISVDTLAPEVFTSGKGGSLQLDLISASRRHGMLAVPIDGMENLLKEVAAGHPVIVLENLAFSWLPQWHYSVVLGYDLKDQELLMHSGSYAFKRTSMNYFERGWRLGNYWGLVVLPPTQMALTASELEHLKAGVGLEQAEQTAAAAQVYQNILKRWPGSLAALIGMGNISYKKGEYARAVAYLKQATALHPESSVARHNLEVAENAVRY